MKHNIFTDQGRDMRAAFIADTPQPRQIVRTGTTFRTSAWRREDRPVKPGHLVLIVIAFALVFSIG